MIARQLAIAFGLSRCSQSSVHSPLCCFVCVYVSVGFALFHVFLSFFFFRERERSGSGRIFVLLKLLLSDKLLFIYSFVSLACVSNYWKVLFHLFLKRLE